MITVEEAFAKFKGRLELTQREQDNASRRQTELREVLREDFDVDRDFLTGSYARFTKTKPLKDIDVFFVLSEKERERYRNKTPQSVLNAFENALKKNYVNVEANRRSVTVDFGVRAQDDDAREAVLSIDAVPAFDVGKHYEIPDTLSSSGWTRTDPEVHKAKATEANDAFSGHWKPLVKMIKKWNEKAGKPIKPSFLVEVMGLDIFHAPFRGGYPYELKGFFATATARISEEWEDPAGLGPPVSDQMTPERVSNARTALQNAEKLCTRAILHEKNGRTGDALATWRELFGPLFPLS